MAGSWYTQAHCIGTLSQVDLWMLRMSTVLAQDRFFSDSLSFTLGIQDPQSHHEDDCVRSNPKTQFQLALPI